MVAISVHAIADDAATAAAATFDHDNNDPFLFFCFRN